MPNSTRLARLTTTMLAVAALVSASLTFIAVRTASAGPESYPPVCTAEMSEFAPYPGVPGATYRQCRPKWGNADMTVSPTTVDPGGTVTATLIGESLNGTYAATMGHIGWSFPGTKVSGCTSFDWTCTVRLGTVGATPPRLWSWSEFRASLPNNYFIDSRGSFCVGQHICASAVTTYGFGYAAVRPGTAKPRASFTAVLDTTSSPVTYTFTSTTPDVGGFTPTLEWDFGDGTAKQQGPKVVIHQFRKPGVVSASLKATLQSESDTASQSLDIPAPKLLITPALEGGGSKLVPDEKVNVEVTIAAGKEGVGDLTQVALDPGLAFSPSDAVEILAGPNPPAPTTLAPGASAVLRYQVRATKGAGLTMSAKATAKDEAGRTVLGEGSAAVRSVLDALKVTLKPSKELLTIEDTEDGPKPQKITVDVTVENTSNAAIDDVALPEKLTTGVVSLLPPPIKHIRQTKAPENLLIGRLGPGQKKTAVYELEITDDGVFSISALVVAKDEIGRGETKVKASSEFLLDFAVKHDAVGPLVQAGTHFVVTGKVKNLSNDKTIVLESLEPERSGNAGLAWVSTDGVVTPKPGDVPTPFTVTLKPGDSKPLFVSVPTYRSRVTPTKPGEEASSPGGTRATLVFFPKGTVTDEENVETKLEDANIRTTDAKRTVVVGLDDSFPMDTPNTIEWALVGTGAFGAGIAEDLVGSVIGGFVLLAAGAKTLKNDPNAFVRGPFAAYYNAWAAWTEMEAEAWKAMTPEQRRAFLQTESQLAAVGLGHVADKAWTALTLAERADKAYRQLEQHMDEQSVAWYTGGWRDVVASSSKAGGTVASQYLQMRGMVGFFKHPEVVAAQQRIKAGLQVRAAALLERLPSVKTAVQAVEVLSKIEPGMVLTAEHLAKVYGVSQHEAQYLAKLAKDWNALIVFRSRHTSSLKWLSGGAVVKSEAVKVKNVNDIDAAFLGYNKDDIGRLAFKEPEGWTEIGGEVNRLLEGPKKSYSKIQKQFDEMPPGPAKDTFELNELASARAALDEARAPVRGFAERMARAKGLSPDDVDQWTAVTDRIETRLNEWSKYGAEYTKPKYLDGKGVQINVGYNYAENGIPGAIAENQSAWRHLKVDKVGDTFVFKQTNIQGVYQNITGDIDFIDLTRLDGTIFDDAFRVKMYKTLQRGAVQMQHGESATSPNFWREYLEKATEPYVQIGPDGVARAVVYDKLNSNVIVEGGRVAAYKHVWTGGYRVAGGAGNPSVVGRLALREPPELDLPDIPPGRSYPALLVDSAGRPAPRIVGSCTLQPSNSPAAQIVVEQDGELATYLPSVGFSFQLDALCRSGQQTTVAVRVGSSVKGFSAPGGNSLDVADSTYLAMNETVVIDPGGANEEMATPVSRSPLTFAAPLKKFHEEGELIVAMSISAAVPPVPTTVAPYVVVGSPASPATAAAVSATTAPSSSTGGTTGSVPLVPTTTSPTTSSPTAASTSASTSAPSTTLLSTTATVSTSASPLATSPALTTQPTSNATTATVAENDGSPNDPGEAPPAAVAAESAADIAFTGSSTLALVFTGVMLLLLGGLITVSATRRTRREQLDTTAGRRA